MKTWIKQSRSAIAAVLAGTALMAAGASVAHADTLVVRDAPAYAAYAQPQLIPVGVQIDIGWHGERYWDGHRYWAHDEWIHRHPHDPGPRHYHDRDHDHRG